MVVQGSCYGVRYLPMNVEQTLKFMRLSPWPEEEIAARASQARLVRPDSGSRRTPVPRPPKCRLIGLGPPIGSLIMTSNT